MNRRTRCFSEKKDIRWPIGTQKRPQHHQSSNTKSKPTLRTSHFPPIRMSYIRIQEITHTGKDAEKREALYIVGGNVNWSTNWSTMQNNMEVAQKNKNRPNVWSSNSTSEYIPKENENLISKRYMHSIFITLLFIIPKI